MTLSRRDTLKRLGLGAAAAVSPVLAPPPSAPPPPSAAPRPSPAETADRARRMKWWHEAKFGMFIHWGLYSVLGRHEWAMENEAFPVAEYEVLAKRFNPKPNAARDWARL